MTLSCSSKKPLAEESKQITTSTNYSKEVNEEEQISSSSSESIATIQNLNIIPMEVTETLKYYDTPFPARGVAPDPSPLDADSGWKFVNIRLAFENPSNSFVTINSWNSLSGIKLKTEQGWLYEFDTSWDMITLDAFLPFWQYNKNIITDRFKIPGGFRIAGSNLFETYAYDSRLEYYFLRFRAAEKSSVYTLLIPGYPDIELKSNLNDIVFPTTLPNNSFRAKGDIINISDKGSLRVLDFARTNDSDTAFLQAELSNNSEGYDQKFNIGFIFVGDDGIFRCQESETFGGLTHLDLDMPEYISVGPGQTENLKIKTYIPNDVKNIKLIVTGDIDVVMNLD